MESHYLLILCWLPWTQMMKAEVRMMAIENLERSTCRARLFLEGHRVMPSLSRNRRDFWSSQPLKTLTTPMQLKRMEDVPTDWRSLKTAGSWSPVGAPPLLTLWWKNPTGTSRGHFGWFSWPSLCPAAESCVGSMRLYWHKCTRFSFFLSSHESSFSLKETKSSYDLRLSWVFFFFYLESFTRYDFLSVVCWHHGTP